MEWIEPLNPPRFVAMHCGCGAEIEVALTKAVPQYSIFFSARFYDLSRFTGDAFALGQCSACGRIRMVRPATGKELEELKSASSAT